MYRLERIEFENPLFSYVDTCVVLTMKGSTRREHYMEQLHTFRPCRNVIVQHNPGYSSKVGINTIDEDYVHAVINALSLTDGPILLLEDDVVFLPRIARHIDTIETFLGENSMWDVYGLGVLPMMCVPFQTGPHVRVETMACSHAWIYHPRMRSIMNIVRTKVTNYKYPPDMITSYQSTCFAFRAPLAIQSHPITGQMNRQSTRTRLAVWLLGAHRDGRSLYNLFHASILLGGLWPTLTVVTCVSICLVSKAVLMRIP